MISLLSRGLSIGLPQLAPRVVQPGTSLTLWIQGQAALSTPRGPGPASFCGPPLSLPQREGTCRWLPSRLPGRDCGASSLMGAQTSPLASTGCPLLPTTPRCPDLCLLIPEATGLPVMLSPRFGGGSAHGSPRTLTRPKLSALLMLLCSTEAVPQAAGAVDARALGRLWLSFRRRWLQQGRSRNKGQAGPTACGHMAVLSRDVCATADEMERLRAEQRGLTPRGKDWASVQFTRSVMSDSWQPHGLQHARLPCPSPTPGACSNSCPSSW